MTNNQSIQVILVAVQYPSCGIISMKKNKYYSFGLNNPLNIHAAFSDISSNVVMQVHMCNKLARRHVRVGLADPNKVQRCDICENAPGILSYL